MQKALISKYLNNYSSNTSESYEEKDYEKKIKQLEEEINNKYKQKLDEGKENELETNIKQNFNKYAIPCNTLESCTSSEFIDGINKQNVNQNSVVMEEDKDLLKNMKIEIKNID